MLCFKYVYQQVKFETGGKTTSRNIPSGCPDKSKLDRLNIYPHVDTYFQHYKYAIFITGLTD